MYSYIENFGHHIHGKKIGESWIDMCKAILDHGDTTSDEGRKRLSLQNVRFKVSNFEIPDKIFEKYANKENIDAIVYLTFEGEEMYDFDVVPSFSPGARSYHQRLKEGRMEEYVVKRLSKIPESKKAAISFIHWDDYKAVLDTPYDDYLPCMVIVQFRITEKDGELHMSTNFYARSMDGFQKGNGNILVLGMLANRIAKKISKNIGREVKTGVIDGFITDVHIYEECISDAKKLCELVGDEHRS